MKTIYVVFIGLGIGIGITVIGLLAYLAFKPVKTEVKVSPAPVIYQSTAPVVAPKTTTPTTQPTQSASEQKAIDNLKNFKASDSFYSPSVSPSAYTAPTVKPLTDCEKKGYWNCN